MMHVKKQITFSKGVFITFEGGEGSGKTAQITLLQAMIDDQYKVFCTREPGGTPIGEQIREILLKNKNAGMNARTETLLFQASRSQFVEQVIIPRIDPTLNY